MVSSYGNVKPGADDGEPEYSYMSWFAMLFGAGSASGRKQRDRHRPVDDCRRALSGNRRAMRKRASRVSCSRRPPPRLAGESPAPRSEEHTSELQSLMRLSYDVFCVKKKKKKKDT